MRNIYIIVRIQVRRIQRQMSGPCLVDLQISPTYKLKLGWLVTIWEQCEFYYLSMKMKYENEEKK